MPTLFTYLQDIHRHRAWVGDTGIFKGGRAKQKNRRQQIKIAAEGRNVAEGEGFEPPMPCGTPVFKTGAINHSAIPPAQAKHLFARAERIIPKSPRREKSLHDETIFAIIM